MTTKYSRVALATGLAVSAALILSACAAPAGDGTMMDGDGDQNAADVMFVEMMIPHHRDAVEMSEVILAKEGIDADVVALAEQIRAAQEPEITLMEQWLDDWGVPSMGGMDGMDHGGSGGMSGMDEEQLDALQAAEGAEASALFLELMIEHHEGAIDMAEEVIDDGRSADVRELAEQIIASQSAEIVTMIELQSR